ncbi:V(D)J recombination-activating protein 1-like [Hydra vulgaris]|uniref:V(D)J recombination-activating protein 1-like n=1 Tax=Hydra vulgaris TaxID=6087 RepID=UPI0032E9FF47
MELHNKNIKFLCRVCGQLLGKKHYFIGEVLKVKLEKLFYVEMTDLEIVHPPKIKTSTAPGPCTKWKPHCDDCFFCQSVKVLRKGLVVSKQQSRNKARCGRQKNEPQMCTFAMFTTIKEAIAIIHDEDIDISELTNELNPHLQHCICNICGKIPKQPLTLKKCEHLFCFFCIVENVKLKPISKAICPQCQEHLLYKDLLTKYEIYKNHNDICSKKATFLSLTLPLSALAVSPTTYLKPYLSKTNISDVFKLTKDSVVPRIVEY